MDIQNNIRKRIFKVYKKIGNPPASSRMFIYSTLHDVDNKFAMLRTIKFE